MAESVDQRKSWEAPTLTVLGDLETLTATGTNASPDLTPGLS